jgi:serine/threonine protein kinase
MRYREVPMHEIAQAHSSLVPPLLTRFNPKPQNLNSSIALVFPYVNGMSLFELDILKLLSNHDDKAALAVSNIFQKTLRFLIDMKKAHLVYADLHSSNILLGTIHNDDECKIGFKVWIVDFGISFLESQKKNFFSQTISVRSPEAYLNNKAAFSHHMDMWSVGCLIYELFMGKYLFPAKDEIIFPCFSSKIIYRFFSVLSLILPQNDFAKFIDWMNSGHLPEDDIWKNLFYTEGNEKGRLQDPSFASSWPANPMGVFETSVKDQLLPFSELAEAFIKIIKGCLKLIPEDRMSPEEAENLLTIAAATSITNFQKQQILKEHGAAEPSPALTDAVAAITTPGAISGSP